MAGRLRAEGCGHVLDCGATPNAASHNNPVKKIDPNKVFAGPTSLHTAPQGTFNTGTQNSFKEERILLLLLECTQ